MIRIKRSETEIADADYHKALHSAYRVWMVEPQTGSARLVEYEMDQEAFEEFFEEYTRFADILVRVDAVEPPVTEQGQPASAAPEMVS